MDTEVIQKLNQFIIEIDDCQRNNCFEEIKSRIKSYLIGIYGENHHFCKNGVLDKSLERVDFAGLYSHSRNGKWIDTSISENRPLTKNKQPLMAHIRKVVEIISKDGLPPNMRPATIISVNNSPGANIAADINGHNTQSSSVTMSDFDKHYAPAIKEIDDTSYLTAEQKEELLDMLELFKESIDKEETPKKTILKTLANYSLYATSIGANMVTLWGFIEPYINQLPK